jgi:hypothetical protein
MLEPPHHLARFHSESHDRDGTIPNKGHQRLLQQNLPRGDIRLLFAATKSVYGIGRAASETMPTFCE